MKTLKIKIKFIEELLGGCPSEKSIYREYIASKAPDAPSKEDEIQHIGVEETAKKGTTIFLKRKDGTPCLSNHTWIGYFKEKVKYIRQEDGSKCKKFTAYKTKIDGNFSILPRFVNLSLPEGKDIELCERTLRADTPQGPIVSLTASEAAPYGTTCSFNLMIGSNEFLPYVIECLDKGFFSGTGQWRSGGKGRFVYEMIDLDTGELVSENTTKWIGSSFDDPLFEDKFNEFIEENIML
jgi:hypothetical protein